MYQGGDVLRIDIRSQAVTVVYAWDNFANLSWGKKGSPDRGGCHVRITDTLGPVLWLDAWTPIASEVRLYTAECSDGGADTDPLKR